MANSGSRAGGRRITFDTGPESWSGGDSDSGSNFVATDRNVGAAEAKEGAQPSIWKYSRHVQEKVRRGQAEISRRFGGIVHLL
jgi:hypothetical protein